MFRDSKNGKLQSNSSSRKQSTAQAETVRSFRIATSSTAMLTMVVLALTLSACTKSGSNSSVKIQLPAKRVSSAALPLNRSAASTNAASRWGYVGPTSGNETDCYAVTVQAPELSQSSCVDSKGNSVAAISTLYGQYAAGSEISIDVKQGSARTIGVWAFKSADGNCSSSTALSSSLYSAPLLIGSTKMDISGPSVTAEINAAFAGAPAIEQCSGGDVGTWPPVESCTPKINRVSLITGNQLKVEGSCLDQTSGMHLEDKLTTVKTVMNVATRTPTSIAAAVAVSLTMKVGQVFNVILPSSNANATAAPVVAQLTLVVDTVKTLKDSGGSVQGTVVGDIYGGGFLVRRADGTLANYTIADDGSLNLSAGLYMLPQAFSGLTLSSRDQIMTKSGSGGYSQYFTGTGCLGSPIASMYGAGGSTATILGNYVQYYTCVSPSSCVPIIGKVTSTMNFNSNITSLSHIVYSSANTITCLDQTTTVSGAILSSISPTTAADQPTIAAGWQLVE